MSRATRTGLRQQSEPAACEVVAAALRERYGVPFEADDVLMTNGAFAALAVALSALVDPGEQVIYNSPGWFFYEPIILNNGALPVRVQVDPITFDLDLDAIAGAINEHTRAVIVNSPNNPTGKIYPEATIARLSELLLQAGERLRAADLAAFRRCIQPDCVRRTRVSQSRDDVSVRPPAVHLRQSAADAGPAYRLYRATTRCGSAMRCVMP